jgi:hypothetical protein
MEYNLDGKVFKSLANTENGEVDDETLFRYHQEGNRVWAEYAGGAIILGHLVAIKQEDGSLEMHYQHINKDDQIMIGKCKSVPSRNSDGKLMFTEHWQWLNGDMSSGVSTIVEV